jgi:hypothetical protein
VVSTEARHWGVVCLAVEHRHRRPHRAHDQIDQ